jgi:hypothetical protein
MAARQAKKAAGKPRWPSGKKDGHPAKKRAGKPKKPPGSQKTGPGSSEAIRTAKKQGRGGKNAPILFGPDMVPRLPPLGVGDPLLDLVSMLIDLRDERLRMGLNQLVDLVDVS